MKKLLTLIISALLLVTTCIGFTACGGNQDKLIVGVTIYEPMDYKDEKGKWVGFDAELAKMFAETLDKKVQFQIIVWKNKVAELNSNQIDLVWNGMTASEDLGKEIDFSVSYAKNTQVAVVKKGSQITTKEQIKVANVVVENGSAGNIVATEEGMTKVQPVKAQVNALLEVNAGTSEVAIIDYTMAKNVVGKGDYANLQIVEGVTYGNELFAVGLKKGNTELKAKLDAFLKEKYADGTMAQLATKYNVSLNEEALGA